MPDYQTADGNWIHKHKWSTVCEKLRELHGDGYDCRGFMVRTDARKGDETRADAHPRTQAVFRTPGDTSQSPPGHGAAETSTTASREPRRVEETAFNDAEAVLAELDAYLEAQPNELDERDAADADDIDIDEKADAHGGAGQGGFDVGDDGGAEYDDGVSAGATRVMEHAATLPRAYVDGGVRPEVVATYPRVAAHQQKAEADGVGWRGWTVALVVCAGILYSAYAALMFLASLLGLGGDPPDLSTRDDDDTTNTSTGPVVTTVIGAGEGVPTTAEGVSVLEAERRLDLDQAARCRAQAALSAAGFDPGPVDGRFGDGTREALRDWQQARGLRTTGYLDSDAAEALRAFGASVPGCPPVNAPVDAGGAAATLTVRGDPSSSIEVDGRVIGVVPASGVVVVPDVGPGERVVVARREGYFPTTSVVEVAGDRAVVVDVTAEGMPGRLTASTDVAGALLRIGNTEERSLPVTDLEIPPGSHDLVVSREGYRPVTDRLDIRPGQLVSLEFVLEPIPVAERVRAALAPAEAHFRAQNYRAAVDAVRSVLDVAGNSPRANWMLGAGLYELREFPGSVTPLARAIALGVDVVLPAKHRHGGGGFREGFCEGTLTLSLTEIAFASFDAPDHGFAVAPDKVAEPTITGSVGGFPFRLNTSVRDPDRGIERNNFDFVHRNAARQAAPAESLRQTVLGCADCDASLHVPHALMTILIRSVNQ